MRPPRASWWRSAAPEVSPGAPPSPLGRLPRPASRLVPARSSASGRRAAPTNRVRLASRACCGPPPRRVVSGVVGVVGGGGLSSPRVASPRSARACARVRPGGPSRAGVRAMCVKVDLRLAGRSPFPLGRGVGPGPGPSAPVPVPRLGRGGRAGRLRSPSLWPSSGVRHPCARARRRGSEPGLGRAPGLDRRRARALRPHGRDCPPGRAPRSASRSLPERRGRPAGWGSAVPASLPPARARARGRRLPRGCRARIGRSASSHAGRARGGGRRARRGGCVRWVGARARA